MNKFAKVMCMIAVVALAFTSCKKKETERAFIKDVTTQEFVQVYDGEDGAKAYFDGNKMKFELGDRFLLFAYNPANSTNGCNMYEYQNYPGFSVPVWVEQCLPSELIETSNTWYAFYPGDNVTNIQLGTEHARATFTLSDEQTYRPGNIVPANALYMAAKDASHTSLYDMNLSFQSICGIACLQFYSTSGRTVESIVLTDHAFNIVGKVSCNIDQIDSDVLQSLCENYDTNHATLYQTLVEQFGYEANYQSRTITLDCSNGGNGVALGADAEHATKFYIVMRPLALLRGVDITVKFKDGGPDWEISSERDNRIMPNVIKNINPRDVG